MLVGKPKMKTLLDRPRANEKIILKWVLNKS
jgi:hypothetical protein